MDRQTQSNVVSINKTYIILLNTLAALIISILFLADSTINKLMSYPQGVIFLKPNADENSINNLIGMVKGENNISSYTYNSKEKEQQKFLNYINNPELQNSTVASFIPGDIEITLKEFKNINELTNKLKSINGVQEVKFITNNIENIKKFVLLFKIFSIVFLIVILCITILKIWIIVTESKKYKSKALINNILLILISVCAYAIIVSPIIFVSLNLEIIRINGLFYLLLLVLSYSLISALIASAIAYKSKRDNSISTILNN